MPFTRPSSSRLVVDSLKIAPTVEVRREIKEDGSPGPYRLLVNGNITVDGAQADGSNRLPIPVELASVLTDAQRMTLRQLLLDVALKLSTDLDLVISDEKGKPAVLPTARA